MYKRIAAKYGVEWKARNYDTQEWDKGDLPNRCLSAATSCLYGVTEAAVLAADYAPAIGFKISRNDRCPCGSGKKYKKCCLNDNAAG